MLKSVKTQIVWDILSPNERVAYVLPPLYDLEDPYIQTYCTQTLQAIFASRPKYLVLYCNQNEDPSKVSLLTYEQFFQVEIQWLTDLSHLTNPDFMEYHTPRKTYLYQKPLVLPSSYFDSVVNDNLSTSVLSSRTGKLVLEEFINHNFYLKKLKTRLEQPLSMHQPIHEDYDVAFVLGEDIPSPQALEPHFTELIKRNQCSAIYSIHPTLNNHLRTFKKTRFPLRLAKQINPTTLLDTLKKVALNYTTILFLGKLTIDNKDWQDFLTTLKPHALFDPYAFFTLLQNQTDKDNYRLTLQPAQLLRRFITEQE